MGLLDRPHNVFTNWTLNKWISRQCLGPGNYSVLSLDLSVLTGAAPFCEHQRICTRVLYAIMFRFFLIFYWGKVQSFKKLKCGNQWHWQVLNGSSETLGVAALKLRGVHTESYWYWIAVVAMVAYFFLFNGISALALAYLDREHSYLKCKILTIYVYFATLTEMLLSILWKHMQNMENLNPVLFQNKPQRTTA